MKGFDRINIKSAVKSRSYMRLRQSHLTTMDFGQLGVLYHRSLIPGDEFHVPAKYFTRMAPLVKPTFGKFSFRTASFFVPYHQVAFDAEAFMQGKTMFEGFVPQLRTFNYYQFVMFLTDSSLSTYVASTAVYDWVIIDVTGTKKYLKFTNKGRYYLKILTQLGYSLPSQVDLQSSSTWTNTFASRKLNALPLLCFFKAYNDYMSQSTRYNTSDLSYLLQQIKRNIAVSGKYQTNNGIMKAGLLALFDSLRIGYDNDYFTTAWQKPNQPINDVQDISVINSPGTSDQIFNTVDNNWLSQSSNDEINQRSLNLLRSFYDFVKRHNYAGSRDVQQTFAQYGIKSEDYYVRFAHILNTTEDPVQVGDITSMASTTGAELGDYSGKGIMGAEHNVDYKSSDFGMLFILGWFTVTPSYPYGFEREVLKSDPLDFYNPEFDGATVDAISYGEIFANPLADPSQDTLLDDTVFGFTEKYNDYRYGRDQVTGDFRDYHVNGDMNVWHTARLLNKVREDGYLAAQSSTMNTMDPVDSEYNRIFSVVNAGVDHFYLTCHFDVTAKRPMLSLNQVPGLGEGELSVPRNGNTLT